MKTVITWLIFIALVAAAVYAVPRALRLALDAEEPILTVQSESMWPQLTRGDMVFVKQVSPSDIRVGTVIIFKHSNGLAIHRVVKYNGDSITTKGDANPTADDPISVKDVVGRAVMMGDHIFKIPWVGLISLSLHPDAENSPTAAPPGISLISRIWLWLASPVGIIFIILIFLIIFESYLRQFFNWLKPLTPRKLRQQILLKRIAAVRGEACAKRALRLK